MFKSIAFSLTLMLLVACSGRTANLPSSVSYNSMSTSRGTSSRVISSNVSAQSAQTADTTGSRLSARQTGMQDAEAPNYGNAERTANREAEIDSGSMVDDSADANPDSRSSEKASSGCGGSYDETLLCNGASGSDY